MESFPVLGLGGLTLPPLHASPRSRPRPLPSLSDRDPSAKAAPRPPAAPGGRPFPALGGRWGQCPPGLGPPTQGLSRDSYEPRRTGEDGMGTPEPPPAGAQSCRGDWPPRLPLSGCLLDTRLSLSGSGSRGLSSRAPPQPAAHLLLYGAPPGGVRGRPRLGTPAHHSQRGRLLPSRGLGSL